MRYVLVRHLWNSRTRAQASKQGATAFSSCCRPQTSLLESERLVGLARFLIVHGISSHTDRKPASTSFSILSLLGPDVEVAPIERLCKLTSFHCAQKKQQQKPPCIIPIMLTNDDRGGSHLMTRHFIYGRQNVCPARSHAR